MNFDFISLSTSDFSIYLKHRKTYRSEEPEEIKRRALGRQNEKGQGAKEDRRNIV